MPVNQGELQMVATRVTLKNMSAQKQSVLLYAVVRPVGAAGGPIHAISVSNHDILLIDGQPALVSGQIADAAGVLGEDQIGQAALKGQIPAGQDAASAPGDCSGAFRFGVALDPGQEKSLQFVSPVHPGRKVNGHKWDGTSPWAQLDLNMPYSEDGKYPQPAPSLEFYRDRARCTANGIIESARAYWKKFGHKVEFDLPDCRWADGFRAISSHCAVTMNEGAPDVAVVNYNVFNRDGMYIANIFQKSGNFELAGSAIDYFLEHPFNGRIQPEADNPGQILWIMGEQWKFTKNTVWLKRVYPSVRKLADMIHYYRTTPGPHWVCETNLGFGDALTPAQRKELKPGACDGNNPAYTEAYDIAGLRAAALLAKAASQDADRKSWQSLSDELFHGYRQRYESNLAAGYGSYCVLWPCRLYPLREGAARDQFLKYGVQKPTDWRYFPMARAHQGLLAGNRNAGWETLQVHLEHPQMHGWFAFDEGGLSGIGNWDRLRSRIEIKPFDGKTLGTMAMPHGWAIAEFHLLLRDSLAYEDNLRLVLFSGIPENWFEKPMSVHNMPTHFGRLSFDYSANSKSLDVAIEEPPADGISLRLPAGFAKKIIADGTESHPELDGSVHITARTLTRVKFD